MYNDVIKSQNSSEYFAGLGSVAAQDEYQFNVDPPSTLFPTDAPSNNFTDMDAAGRPKITKYNPDRGGHMAANQNIVLTFDQNVVAGDPPSYPAGPSGYVYLHYDDQHQIKIAINDTTHITFSSNIVTINPPHDLDANKT